MKAIPVLIALFLCTCTGAQNIKKYQCFWHEKNVDPFQTKYQDFKYSEKGMFYYYISNDQDNIYINLRIFDDNIKRVVLRSGITVWINTDGKKNKTLGVKYPAGPQSTGNKISDDVGNSLLLIGFNKSGNILVSTFENDNFRGSIRTQKEYIYYQLILPISKLPAIKKNPKKKGETFVMGLSHGSIQSMSMYGRGSAGGNNLQGDRIRGGGGRMGGGGGRMGGGGGRMGGGGGRMRGGGGMRESGSGSQSAVIVWFENIKLATE